MRGVKTAGFVLMCLFLSSATVFGADAAKIGVVDFQRILETSNAGKAAQEKINLHGKEMEAELQKRGAEINETKAKLEREALVMTKEIREEKERQLRISINDLKVMQQKYIGEFKAREARLIQGIQKEVFKLVEKIGKTEGYLLIVERRGVLYFPDAIDLSDRLIQLYNAEYAKAKTAEEKPKKE
jgi:outer membrane protein